MNVKGVRNFYISLKWSHKVSCNDDFQMMKLQTRSLFSILQEEKLELKMSSAKELHRFCHHNILVIFCLWQLTCNFSEIKLYWELDDFSLFMLSCTNSDKY